MIERSFLFFQQPSISKRKGKWRQNSGRFPPCQYAAPFSKNQKMERNREKKKRERESSRKENSETNKETENARFLREDGSRRNSE